MPKKMTNNQDRGHAGEDQFKYWASSVMHWYATKADPDSGFDFLCQLRGKRIDSHACIMDGKVLSVSVRSTDRTKSKIRIDRSDIELLLSATTPAVIALVQRAPYGQVGKVAIRVPDELFIRECQLFLTGRGKSRSVSFDDALAVPGDIQKAVEDLCSQWYPGLVVRARAKFLLEGLLPDAQFEVLQTDCGSYVRIRSDQFKAEMDISERPDVADALKSIGLPFKVLLPIGVQAPQRTRTEEAASDLLKHETPEIALTRQAHQFTESTTVTQLSDDLASVATRVNAELAVWNYANALAIAKKLESVVASPDAVGNRAVSQTLVLLARVHINSGEIRPDAVDRHVQQADIALGQAEGMLDVNDQLYLKIAALRAALSNLRSGPAAALVLLGDRTDPYAIRTRTALLLNQQKYVEAMAVIDGLDPHEWWCDVAVKAYAHNGQIEKAQALVRWAAGLPDRSRYPQCVVRLAEGLMAGVLTGYGQEGYLLPREITDEDHDKLVLVAETLLPVLQTIRAAGKPTSGLDMAALQMACQANHLLQRQNIVTELLGLMSQWTPVPVEVARGVVSGYITAQPDLPDRLRKDHPDDLGAGMMATIIEFSLFGKHADAFAHAKRLLPLADDNQKKEDLFKLFHTIWQSAEGSMAAECEAIVETLVTHNPRLNALFNAAVALRKGETDRAIELLDGQSADDDPLWLQLKSNALIQKKRFAEAVDFLLRAAKLTDDPALLRQTGDIAFQVKRYDIAVSSYERLAKIQPRNLVVRNNLAHIYATILHDVAKAAEQFRALHAAEPDDPKHAFNLAICLTQLFRPDESLPLYDQVCRQENPPIQAVVGRAQLHHSLGRPDAALASLQPFRERLWGQPDFLVMFLATAHAAGDDAAAHEALMALNRLREQGAVKPEAFRMVRQDEGLEIFKQAHKQEQDRNQHLHTEMLKGRMPWIWADQVSNTALYWGWCARTQTMRWIGDEPANRARFCIYATNGFHTGESENGKRELLPLTCPPSGTKVVADVSALITLHRLDLLDATAEYFGEILVPAGYLPTVLEESRQMVLHQRSRRQSAESIVGQVNLDRIVALAEGTEKASAMAIADEYTESAEHRYRLRDLIDPVHQAGLVNDADFARISRLCQKPSAVTDQHSALEQFQDVMVDLTTLGTVANEGLLETLTDFYRIHITAAAHQELIQRLNAMARQEETRQWHMDLWNQLRGNKRFKFVPHSIPAEMQKDDLDAKDYLPFLACFIAQEAKTPLLADDRVCQAFTLNELTDVPHAAFGSDALARALMADNKLEPDKTVEVICQLMAWRYRFIVPSAEELKLLADRYRTNPPGHALLAMAEYAQDCMRDPGIFSGPENTDMKDSMAIRLYLTWVAEISDFLVLVWADEEFTSECATRLTEWSCRELLPACPAVVDGDMTIRVGEMTARLLLTRALFKTLDYPGEFRMADAMTAMKNALHLGDDGYTRIVTGILYDTARTAPQS